MASFFKTQWLAVLVALVMVGSFASSFVGSGQTFGAAADLTTIGNPWTFTSTGVGKGVTMASTTITSLKAGQTGTQLSRVNAGTCYVLAYATTIDATSTAIVDCQATAAVGGITTVNASALAGVTAGDAVIAQFATSTSGSTLGGVKIIGASASTTSGYIQLNVANLTGTTFTWPTTGTATGTVNYLVIDPS